jgi:hypothetical protein
MRSVAGCGPAVYFTSAQRATGSKPKEASE